MIFRPEHPKPQFARKNWVNLNGEWQFEIDNSNSGKSRNLYDINAEFSQSINVPFCPESKLSGIEHTDFLNAVWYKRTFEITKEQLSGKVFMHFGAIDYEAFIYINGNLAKTHKGGYVSFYADITEFVLEGVNTVTVNAVDDTRSRLIPSGKQSNQLNSYGCFYTRTTGIWQTVWLEFRPNNFIESVKYYPNISDSSVTVNAKLCGCGNFKCNITFNGEPMGNYEVLEASGNITFNIKLSKTHLWEVGNGRLYDVEFFFDSDCVTSYFGLREVRLDGMRFLINNKSVFQRLVLDQGFYPDGIYTAPSDEALINDIKFSQKVGFNGARLHEKIFEERFLYHADRLGYIVWGEYPDWGLDHSYEDNIYAILPEWIEEVERDFNHPSIIGWCPHNETWLHHSRKQYNPSIEMVFDVTKALDSTRPCIDTSGGLHVKTDIFCVHEYEQNPQIFKANYDRLMTEGVLYDRLNNRLFWTQYDDPEIYRGEPVFMSEYGGIAWDINGNGWGYGQGPKTIEEFYQRFKGLTDALLDNSCMFGLCYTQLTDVEQEQNGIYTYDRKPKFDSKILYDIMTRKAAIED